MASMPFNKIERAHQMYKEGRHKEALMFYTEALAISKTDLQMIALHSNRAACYLKLQDFQKAAEECSSVLELDPKHSGALMLRAQTLVTLKEYHSALFDVDRLLELNPLSEVYQNLQACLKTQLSLAPIPECDSELEEEVEDEGEHDSGGETSFGVRGNNALEVNRWQTLPKAKGHEKLDYSRWDHVNVSSDEDDGDEDDGDGSLPQFRVKTIGVRAVR